MMSQHANEPAPTSSEAMISRVSTGSPIIGPFRSNIYVPSKSANRGLSTRLMRTIFSAKRACWRSLMGTGNAAPLVLEPETDRGIRMHLRDRQCNKDINVVQQALGQFHIHMTPGHDSINGLGFTPAEIEHSNAKPFLQIVQSMRFESFLSRERVVSAVGFPDNDVGRYFPKYFDGRREKLTRHSNTRLRSAPS